MPVIDLFAGLRTVGSSRSRKGSSIAVNKTVLEIEAPPFLVNVDEDAAAGEVAKAVCAQIKENLLAGAALDGTPAPPLAASTLERRRYRLAQAKRGGRLAPRYGLEEQRQGMKNWRRRYKTTRMGSFSPRTNPASITTRAVESGMLVNSLAAERNPPGWRIYFADARGLTDRTGMSPAGRALGLMVDSDAVWGRVLKQPKVQKAMRQALLNMLPGGKNKKSSSLLGELATAVESVEGIGGS